MSHVLFSSPAAHPRVTRFAALLLPLLLVAGVIGTGSVTGTASAGQIEAANDSTRDSAIKFVQTDKGQVTTITNPRRRGQRAFKFLLPNGNPARAELEMKRRPRIGDTNWYGWSFRIDGTWPNNSRGIVTQFACYPTNKDFWNKGAAGVGSYIIIGPARNNANYGAPNRVTFVLQHQGDRDGIRVTTFDLGPVSYFKNRWVDIVMKVRWTGNSNGFLELWQRPRGWRNYTRKINYRGTTFWNDEGVAPYFKCGLYGRSTDLGVYGARRVFFDAYEHHGASSGFWDVAP